jgi:hypothetical protein
VSSSPKRHPNEKVQAFLSNYYFVSELCGEFPQIDDIFSGVLALKTSGDTASRSFSRSVLFHILQWCPVIDVDSVEMLTAGKYASNTVSRYTSLARVTSKAIERFVETLPSWPIECTVKEAREALDAPHKEALKALGLI